MVLSCTTKTHVKPPWQIFYQFIREWNFIIISDIVFICSAFAVYFRTSISCFPFRVLSHIQKFPSSGHHLGLEVKVDNGAQMLEIGWGLSKENLLSFHSGLKLWYQGWKSVLHVPSLPLVHFVHFILWHGLHEWNSRNTYRLTSLSACQLPKFSSFFTTNLHIPLWIFWKFEFDH